MISQKYLLVMKVLQNTCINYSIKLYQKYFWHFANVPYYINLFKNQ